jgi:hypothetical protein
VGATLLLCRRAHPYSARQDRGRFAVDGSGFGTLAPVIGLVQVGGNPTRSSHVPEIDLHRRRLGVADLLSPSSLAASGGRGGRASSLASAVTPGRSRMARQRDALATRRVGDA